jgi:hypothetical protein
LSPVIEVEPTAPTACGLALALPMDFAAVERAVQGGAYSDYVGRAAWLGSPQRVWEQGFQKVAAAATKFSLDAAALGVVVARDATLADLRGLFECCAVITIVAHWRGPEVDAADIRLDPARILDRLEHEQSSTAQLIRAGLPPDWKEKILRAGTGGAQKSLLAELLDRRMRHLPHLVAAPDSVEWHMDAATLQHANRAALDGWWPEAFAPGNRLELADGLHAPERIGACVPRCWSGVADLSNCLSAQLIEQIKQARSDRIVISNERETNPLSRMALICVIYEALAKQPCNYAQIRVALSQAMKG